MNRIQRFGISLLFGLTCISPTAFAGYLTFDAKGTSRSGHFNFSIKPADIQASKDNQIPLDVVGITKSFHNTGVDLSFDVKRPNDLFSITPIWDKKGVQEWKLTYLHFDMYIDEDPNDKKPGFEIPIKVIYFDARLFMLDNKDPLILKFTAIDPSNDENARATFVFQEAPEPSSLLLFLLGLSMLGLRPFFRKA